MKILKEGDTSEAICERCESRVATHYEYRMVHLEESNVDVEDVLVGVCDECDSVVSIPSQSFPKLKEARAEKNKKIEVRVPLELDDIVRLISDHYEVPGAAFRAYLIRYYLHIIGKNEAFARRVKRLSERELAQLKARARVSLRLRSDLREEAWETARSVGIESWADLIKGIVLAGQEDVLENKAPRRQEDLECIAAST